MLHHYKHQNYKMNTATIGKNSAYLHGTPAQLDHFKQHHVFHAIFLVVAIYPACPLDSLAFLPCCFLPLLSTLRENITINEECKLAKHLESANLVVQLGTKNPCSVSRLYLSFSCVCAPSIRIFREVCV